MGLKFKNNAATTLAALVASTDLSLTVNSTLGAVFPALGGGDYFYCTLQSLTTPSTIEVVKVTAVAGNTFTIVRAQDGTAAQNFSVGDRVELRLVAAVLNDIPKLDETNTFQLALTLLQSLTVAGLVTAQGGLLAQSGLTLADNSKFSTVNQLGLRNKIINGNFGINQRAVAGAVVLAAGVYGHDRWKAGAAGCSYTFATVANVTTITITAGSLQQVIEGNNLQSGNHVLSWTGTAQGKVDAGAFGASPVAGVAVGGTNQTIEFGVGTIKQVQYEPGTVPSLFEQRFFGLELMLCQRYYEVMRAHLVGSGYVAGAFVGATMKYQVAKRVAATVGTATGATATNFTGPNTNNLTTDGFTLFGTATAIGGLVEYAADIPVSAEL